MLPLIALAWVLADQSPQTPPQQQDAPPATASVRGRVVAADSGQPLRRALVQISQIDSAGSAPAAVRENRSGSTDADGVYEFKNLPAGRYNLGASKGAFVRAEWGQTASASTGKPLDVHAGERVDHVDFALARGGVITGRIVDESGEPISGLRVSAVRSGTMSGARQPGQIAGASTNDLGEFRIFGIAPGQYVVQALWQRLGPGDPASVDRTGYPRTFFPGTTVEAEAQRFTVGAGRTIGDLVMTIAPIRTARIEGSVVDAQGRPMTGVMLEMLATVGGSNAMSAMALRPDGTFVFPSLPPGDYVFRTQPTATRPEMAMQKLTLGDADITDLRLVAMPPATIAGRVVIDPSSQPPAAALSIASVLDSQAMPGGMRPVRVNDDFTFEVTAWPGRNRISTINLPAGWTIRAVRVDSVDVIDDGIDVSPGQKITGVDVELTTKIATISGLITTARGEVAKECTVVLFPTDSKRWKANSRYIRAARTDQDGRFKLSNVPPSDYYAVAVEKMEPGQSTDADFLERVAPGAKRITVAEGETKTLDLKVAPAS
jgi:protocatechuate 3,4-dioxygenase beta subunit